MLKTDFDDWFSNEKDSRIVDIADPKENSIYASRHQSTPDFEKEAEETVTIHEKMYRLATAKHKPWGPGGSENFQGGSEEIGFVNPLDSMPVATDKSSPNWEETAPSEYEP